MPIDTITIGAGQSAWLPKGSKILAVDATNGLTLSSPSNCVDTTVLPPACFQLQYIVSEAGQPTGAWEESDEANRVKGIFINGVEVVTNFFLNQYTQIVNFLTFSSMGSITNVSYQYNDGNPSDKNDVIFKFKAPIDIGKALYFKFQIAAASGDPIEAIIFAKQVECDNPV
jgi:hypothetical protein